MVLGTSGVEISMTATVVSVVFVTKTGTTASEEASGALPSLPPRKQKKT